MTLHLIKLSVGPEKLSDLARWQEQRLREHARAGRTAELMHVTRNTPKRGAELLEEGSIYWVIKGYIVARQQLLELRPLVVDGAPYCGLVLGHELIRVVPRKHRPFQGWRYLEASAAPKDLALRQSYDDLDGALRDELVGAGLL